MTFQEAGILLLGGMVMFFVLFFFGPGVSRLYEWFRRVVY